MKRSTSNRVTRNTVKAAAAEAAAAQAQQATDFDELFSAIESTSLQFDKHDLLFDPMDLFEPTLTTMSDEDILAQVIKECEIFEEPPQSPPSPPPQKLILEFAPPNKRQKLELKCPHCTRTYHNLKCFTVHTDRHVNGELLSSGRARRRKKNVNILGESAPRGRPFKDPLPNVTIAEGHMLATAASESPGSDKVRTFTRWQDYALLVSTDVSHEAHTRGDVTASIESGENMKLVQHFDAAHTLAATGFLREASSVKVFSVSVANNLFRVCLLHHIKTTPGDSDIAITFSDPNVGTFLSVLVSHLIRQYVTMSALSNIGANEAIRAMRHSCGAIPRTADISNDPDFFNFVYSTFTLSKSPSENYQNFELIPRFGLIREIRRSIRNTLMTTNMEPDFDLVLGVLDRLTSDDALHQLKVLLFDAFFALAVDTVQTFKNAAKNEKIWGRFNGSSPSLLLGQDYLLKMCRQSQEPFVRSISLNAFGRNPRDHVILSN
ncbi:MAG: hypothetical protein MUO31_07545 [Thermodesulfovibrionales bacterium]|nr:hypothetical protein [Thermodesulfovibrionales bacterium]